MNRSLQPSGYYHATPEDSDVKRFTSEEFRRAQRCASFVGAAILWRTIERRVDPDPQTRFHAMGLLQELAKLSLQDCRGMALSPQHRECLEFCGMKPRGVRPPGSLAQEAEQ
ncbi:MAG: hypothetical protein WBY44_01080 [Bryobacteraceae bacterium]